MKFKDFQAPVLFSSTFKALNLGEKNSSTFKYFQGYVGTLQKQTHKKHEYNYKIRKTCEVFHKLFRPSCTADQKAELPRRLGCRQCQGQSLTSVTLFNMDRTCNWLTVNHCQTLLEFLTAKTQHLSTPNKLEKVPRRLISSSGSIISSLSTFV